MQKRKLTGQRASNRLESEGIVNKNDLDASRGKRVGSPKYFEIHNSRGRNTVGIASTSRLGSKGKLVGAGPGLVLILDNLVGTDDNDNVSSAEGDTADLGTGEISVGELAILGDSGHGGEVVVDGGANGAAELGLLGRVLLGKNGGVDVVPGTRSDIRLRIGMAG